MLSLISCWDVIAALMRGETVSLNANQTELKRQERFDKMTQALTEIQSKMDALEAARQQDRNALDNVLFVCKQLERKLVSRVSRRSSLSRPPQLPQPPQRKPTPLHTKDAANGGLRSTSSATPSLA